MCNHRQWLCLYSSHCIQICKVTHTAKVKDSWILLLCPQKHTVVFPHHYIAVVTDKTDQMIPWNVSRSEYKILPYSFFNIFYDTRLEKDPRKRGFYIIFWFIKQAENWKKSSKVIFLLLLFNSICVQRHDLLVISRRYLYMTGSSIFNFTVLPH